MHDLVELKKIDPSIVLEILYATPKNFTGQAVYSSDRCYLQRKTAERLHRVQKILKKKGLGLKVWDGYRPLFVQKIFWSIFPNPTYLADPAKGSKHNRGAAVDLTLIDANGNELLMPSGFDDFTYLPNTGSEEARKNQTILDDAMKAEGFIPLIREWWHFDDPDWETYPILDIPIEELS